MKELKAYIAGKVSKDSVFGTHYWRDEFIEAVSKMSGVSLVNVDPTKTDVPPPTDKETAALIFGCDSYMISKSDVVIVHLSDDISVGGSQEILIAKYFKKPVIGLAPLGGKFNGSTKHYFGEVVENYTDPFVFTTCDVICKDIAEIADVLKSLPSITPKTIDIIAAETAKFEKEQLAQNEYLRSVLQKG